MYVCVCWCMCVFMCMRERSLIRTLIIRAIHYSALISAHVESRARGHVRLVTANVISRGTIM